MHILDYVCIHVFICMYIYVYICMHKEFSYSWSERWFAFQNLQLVNIKTLVHVNKSKCKQSHLHKRISLKKIISPFIATRVVWRLNTYFCRVQLVNKPPNPFIFYSNIIWTELVLHCIVFTDELSLTVKNWEKSHLQFLFHFIVT